MSGCYCVNNSGCKSIGVYSADCKIMFADGLLQGSEYFSCILFFFFMLMTNITFNIKNHIREHILYSSQIKIGIWILNSLYIMSRFFGVGTSHISDYS